MRHHGKIRPGEESTDRIVVYVSPRAGEVLRYNAWRAHESVSYYVRRILEIVCEGLPKEEDEV